MKMRVFKQVLVSILLIVTIQGCETTQTRPLYYWGEYEPLIYDMYHRPGNAPPSEQINKLIETIDKSEGTGRLVAPGIHAHLGFMYAAQGNIGLAEQAFHNEMALYPESRVFIEGMLARVRQRFGAGEKP